METLVIKIDTKAHAKAIAKAIALFNGVKKVENINEDSTHVDKIKDIDTLVVKMKKNAQSDILSKEEENNFLKELNEIAE